MLVTRDLRSWTRCSSTVPLRRGDCFDEVDSPGEPVVVCECCKLRRRGVELLIQSDRLEEAPIVVREESFREGTGWRGFT